MYNIARRQGIHSMSEVHISKKRHVERPQHGGAPSKHPTTPPRNKPRQPKPPAKPTKPTKPTKPAPRPPRAPAPTTPAMTCPAPSPTPAPVPPALATIPRMRFGVVDLSGSLPAAELAAYAAAQQRQLREHYASVFDGDGANDEVRVTTTTAPLVAGEIAIILHPSSAGADEGALGEHGLAANGSGVPSMNIYLDLADKYGETWTSIASHEVLETRADPRLHACVELDNGEIWDREICDRVQAEIVIVDGVPLSNFNTPACFEPTGAPGEFYDWLKLSTKPNEVRPGGYAQQYTSGKGWTQVSEARGYRGELAALGLSRGTRRRVRSRVAAYRNAAGLA